MFFFIVPLVIFLFWHVFGFFSDDASAIESFQSVESVNNEGDVEITEVRRSKKL